MFKKLITWSEKEFSHLPWRKKRSLYRTLVSEIMLQQTTVSTVLNHFERFVSEYPDIETLASASEEQITMSWKGLGYYRRARNLRKAAIDIQENFAGKIPTTMDSLLTINGVGPYTASALIAIGNNKPALAVDANLERVLARIYGVKIEKGPKLLKAIQAMYGEGEIFPDMNKLGPRALNEALMDLGRVYCQARKADCDLCPVRSGCHAFQKARPLDYPIVKETVKESHELDLLRVVVLKGDRVLSYQKKDSEWLAGQWELPTFIISTSDQALSQYPNLNLAPKLSKKINVINLKTFKTAITKYKITNRILVLGEKEFKDLKFKGDFKFKSVDPGVTNHATSTLKVFKNLK